MTTPRDLLIVTMDVPGDRPIEQGDLSLTLAGAELVDLLATEAATLEDDRIVPRLRPATGDRLLDEAGAALVRETPYESVEDWLWRRGRGLAAAYRAELEREERAAGQHHRSRRAGREAAADSPAHRAAADRWAFHEPVLAGLAAAVGIRPGPDQEIPDPGDDAVVTVVAAVHHAVTELEAVRQRRRIEDAAFDNIWRSP